MVAPLGLEVLRDVERHRRLLRVDEAGEVGRQLELAEAEPRGGVRDDARLAPRRAAPRDPRLALGAPRSPASSAASATVRPNVPSVSSRSLSRLMPAVECQPCDGLKPTTPQNDAGPDDRAGGLGAVGERDHPVGDRGGRPARGAARRAVEVVRVAGRRRLVGGELGRHRLAEDHRALLAQPGDAVGVARRPVALVDRRAVRGRHVGGVDDVLHADRDPVQRPPRRLGITRPRLRERLLRVEVRPRRRPRRRAPRSAPGTPGTISSERSCPATPPQTYPAQRSATMIR